MNKLAERKGIICFSFILLLMTLAATTAFSEDLVKFFHEIQPLFNAIFFSFSYYAKL